VKLELPQRAASAVETNLMEKPQQGQLGQNAGPVKLAADGRSLSLATGPYEIRTVEVAFAPEK
jgi:hypothetical protein